MAKNKTTSPRVASDAGQALRNPKSSPKTKEFAGSDLAQARPKPKGGKKKGK